MDQPILALDVETYGAVKRTLEGTNLPTQMEKRGNGRFHPAKMVYWDQPGEHFLLSAQISQVTTASSITEQSSVAEWASSVLSSMQPSSSIVFNWYNRTERRLFQRWLRHAKVLIGHNIQFDIMCLREANPGCRGLLNESHLLIDTIILNYLHSENRDEKSLKDLGIITGQYLYEHTLKQDRFKDTEDPHFIEYAAADTHNTLLLARVLTTLCQNFYSNTAKMSAYCLQFYSDVLWNCIRMTETGVAFNRAKLLRLHQRLEARITRIKELCAAHDLLIEGPGSKKSKADFIKRIMQVQPALMDHPLLERTPKTKEISFKRANIQLFATELPPDHELQPLFTKIITHSKLSKLVSSYTFPLLYWRRTHTDQRAKFKPIDRTSALLPWKTSFASGSSYSSQYGYAEPLMKGKIPDDIQPKRAIAREESDEHATNIGIAYGLWYPVPSKANDADDTTGGTEQVRATAKQPAIQTLPKAIQRLICARYDGWVKWGFDLSQIELRVAALLSGEPALVKAFTEGFDLHTARALDIFGHAFFERELGEADPTKNTPGFNLYRQSGKTCNFADLFRSSAATMRASVYASTGHLFPLELFQEIESDRKIHRPVLWAWQESLIKEAGEKHYLELFGTGASRTFTGPSDSHINKIINMPVQATASIVMHDIQTRVRKRMPPLNALRPSWLMGAQVYDSCKFESDAAHKDKHIALVREAIHEAETEGHWALLQEKYGREIPLSYDME